MPKKEQTTRVDFVELPANTAADLQRAKSFYSTVFGWSYKDWGEDYSDTHDSGVGTGINADPEHRTAHPLVVISLHLPACPVAELPARRAA